MRLKWLWIDNGFDYRRLRASESYMITILASKMFLRVRISSDIKLAVLLAHGWFWITRTLWHQMRIQLLNIWLPTEIISLSQQWQVCGLFFAEVHRASVIIPSYTIIMWRRIQCLYESRIFLLNTCVFHVFKPYSLTFLIPHQIHKKKTRKSNAKKYSFFLTHLSLAEPEKSFTEETSSIMFNLVHHRHSRWPCGMFITVTVWEARELSWIFRFQVGSAGLTVRNIIFSLIHWENLIWNSLRETMGAPQCHSYWMTFLFLTLVQYKQLATLSKVIIRMILTYNYIMFGIFLTDKFLSDNSESGSIFQNN